MRRRLAQGALRRALPIALLARRVARQIARPVTVGVRALIVADGKVLLVRMHGQTRWELPGGGVKRGESLRTTAEREAREETGCVVEAERLLGIYLSIHEGMSNHVAVFVCRPITLPAPAFNLEIAETRWWPIDALPRNVASTLPKRLEEYAAGAQGLDGRW